jgi:hypothetical protein
MNADCTLPLGISRQHGRRPTKLQLVPFQRWICTPSAYTWKTSWLPAGARRFSQAPKFGSTAVGAANADTRTDGAWRVRRVPRRIVRGTTS